MNFLAAGLAQALGSGVGVIQAVAMVATFGGLAGALISALSERHTGGIKVSLVIAAVAAVAWILVTTLFAASGITTNITPTGIN
jgi:hypothetical protein